MEKLVEYLVVHSILLSNHLLILVRFILWRRPLRRILGDTNLHYIDQPYQPEFDLMCSYKVLQSAVYADLPKLFYAADPVISMIWESSTEVSSRANMLTVREGGVTTISCSTTGTPLPTISWTLNGQGVDFDSIDRLIEPSVFIHSPGSISTVVGVVNSTIRIVNEGVYVCTGSAVHAGIERTKSATLTVAFLGMFLVSPADKRKNRSSHL
jgi:hypothetical protein